MRNILAACVFSLMIFSCAKNESSSIPDHHSVKVTETSEPKIIIDSAAVLAQKISEGKNLIEGADCLSCHKNDAKLLGPSYLDIAKKYENTPANNAMLAGKIINGGSGVWGNIPMTAHPGMSRENAEKMVAYILSLKK